MKNLLLIAGAAAFAAAAPAAAKPDHAKGHDKGYAKGHAKAAKGHAKFAKQAKYYGYSGACPPGLAKHEGHCMPHGQFKKRYNVGQRYASNYGNAWTYNQIPYDLRSQYNFDQRSRYYYGDGYLYQVNPRTMLIQQVVNAVLR